MHLSQPTPNYSLAFLKNASSLIINRNKTAGTFI